MKPLALCLLSAVAWAAPCTTVANCTEWVNFAGGPARSMIYRTYPLDVPNAQIARALIVIHGAGRDADNYLDRKSTRLNSSHRCISYAVFCLKKKKKTHRSTTVTGQTAYCTNSDNSRCGH